MYCRNCGAQFAPGDSFCGSCGASTSEGITVQPDTHATATQPQTRSRFFSRLPLVWILAGLGGVLVLLVLLAVAASALFARETIEPQPGVFTKMPRGWDVVSSSTPDGTARIADPEAGLVPLLAPEEFSDLSETESSQIEGAKLRLDSAGDKCKDTEDFFRSTDIPSLGSGYEKVTVAGRKLDAGDATVAGRDATWELVYVASADPWRVPGATDAAEYPDYYASVLLSVCIKEFDLSVDYSTSARLAGDPFSSREPPTESRNGLLPESREEVNDDIRESFEENLGVMTRLTEDIDTDGWDGSTDISGLPTDLDDYADALADPFDRELQSEVATPAPESTNPGVVQERTLDIITTPEETTQTGGLEPGSEERFLDAYYSAASNQDWYFTYQALSDDSKGYFTLDQWREVQDARIEQSGGTAPLQDVEILNLTGDAAGATADVELTYEDGTQETVTDVGIAVEGSTIQRDLTPDEISYLQSLLEDGTSSNPECGIWGCPDENGEYTSGPPSE